MEIYTYVLNLLDIDVMGIINESIRSPHHHRKTSPEPRLHTCNKEESVYRHSLLHLQQYIIKCVIGSVEKIGKMNEK